jgi:hypothetical protein
MQEGKCSSEIIFLKMKVKRFVTASGLYDKALELTCLSGLRCERQTVWPMSILQPEFHFHCVELPLVYLKHCLPPHLHVTMCCEKHW